MSITSLDFLYLVLAICIAVLTFSICWAIYYFVASARVIYELIKRVENGVTKAEEIMEVAREKLKNSSAYFMILGEIAKKAMEFVQAKKEKRSATKKK
jgi:hypothetical protein